MNRIMLAALSDELQKIAEQEDKNHSLYKGLAGAGLLAGSGAANTALAIDAMNRKGIEDPGGKLMKGLEPSMAGAHRVESSAFGPGAYVASQRNNTVVNQHLNNAVRQEHQFDDMLADMVRRPGQPKVERAPIPKNKSLIFGPKSLDPAIMSHELGHREINKSTWGKLLQNPVTTGLGMASPLIGMGAGYASGAASDDPTVKRLGIAAPLLAAAPMLAYEGLASIKGLRNLKRIGASPAQMAEARSKLLGAFGTYATHAGTGVGGALVGQAIGEHHRRAKKSAEENPQNKESLCSIIFWKFRTAQTPRRRRSVPSWKDSRAFRSRTCRSSPVERSRWRSSRMVSMATTAGGSTSTRARPCSTRHSRSSRPTFRTPWLVSRTRCSRMARSSGERETRSVCRSGCWTFSSSRRSSRPWLVRLRPLLRKLRPRVLVLLVQVRRTTKSPWVPRASRA